MIQRIQTVYLFLVVVLSAILVWQDPIYARADLESEPSAYVFMYLNSCAPSVDKIYVPELLGWLIGIAVIGISIISIGLFKRRELQMKFTLIVLLLNGVWLGVNYLRYYLILNAHPDYIGHLEIPFIWPVVMVIACVLTYFSIRRDDNRVRNMDRIR